MLVGLCIEEMTSNIVRYGFTPDRRAHQIDLRLVMRDRESIIRIRDNCVRFDPVRYLELHRRDDPIAHIGIRIVMAKAKEVKYLNSFGLNNLTLKL
jgi:anti-sigma regulatory factor (Ser/Thr protein kinase)